MTTIPLELYVTRYQCPCCRKSWSKRSVTAEHIARCWYNPDARSCKTCTHFEPGGGEPETGASWEESCGAGVPFPEHPFREGKTTLPVACPKWQAKTSDGCERGQHEHCEGWTYCGPCYCTCHKEVAW